jgi:hypothetical protein
VHTSTLLDEDQADCGMAADGLNGQGFVTGRAQIPSATTFLN